MIYIFPLVNKSCEAQKQQWPWSYWQVLTSIDCHQWTKPEANQSVALGAMFLHSRAAVNTPWVPQVY